MLVTKANGVKSQESCPYLHPPRPQFSCILCSLDIIILHLLTVKVFESLLENILCLPRRESNVFGVNMNNS